MAGSEARRFLSRLVDAFGVDGALVVWTAGDGGEPEAGAEGADLAPGSGLRWPACECGHSLCPDNKPAASPAQELSARVAERNKWSRQGRP
ncbi:hypothetical protein OG349_21825 [Streptomyces sp. NBC_01317]|uniref:hypothetical protein n=1 Tax=Streptomyces sp. NBC_01317 TaxID=2903822 RepID=UPI002E15A1B8|nr:hypothetical protein OG349_21825 [Streptomyces sp. NBC_01317]